MTDYMMIFGLLLLLIVLSLPTIMQLKAILNERGATPHRALPVKAEGLQSFRFAAPTRISLPRTPVGATNPAAVETQLAR